MFIWTTLGGIPFSCISSKTAKTSRTDRAAWILLLSFGSNCCGELVRALPSDLLAGRGPSPATRPPSPCRPRRFVLEPGGGARRRFWHEWHLCGFVAGAPHSGHFHRSSSASTPTISERAVIGLGMMYGTCGAAHSLRVGAGRHMDARTHHGRAAGDDQSRQQHGGGGTVGSVPTLMNPGYDPTTTECSVTMRAEVCYVTR